MRRRWRRRPELGVADVAARAVGRGRAIGRRSGAGSPRAGTPIPRPTPTRTGTGASAPACPPWRRCGRARARGRPMRRRGGPRRGRAPTATAGRRQRARGGRRSPARPPPRPRARTSSATGRSNRGAARGRRRAARRPAEPFAAAADTIRRATALSASSSDRRALDEEDVQPLVLPRGEQQAARRPAVAARTAGLLVVGLDRAGDALVADGAHVGLVDAHPERVGGDHDRRLAGHEPALRLGARLARQAGVVGDDLDAQLGPEPGGEPLALRARARVDDPRQRARLGQRGGDAPVGGLLARARDDGEREVRAVEAGRHAHRVAQPQAADDVGRHLRRGRGRRREDRLRTEPARGVGQAEVVGPEVVPPLGHAVRLVDHEQPDPRSPDPLEEARRREALRGDVEQPQLAAPRRARPRAG